MTWKCVMEEMVRELEACQYNLGCASAKISCLEAQIEALDRIIAQFVPPEYLDQELLKVPVKSRFYPYDVATVVIKRLI